MKTLNQIKKILIDWFNNHAMISSVYYEDDFDFNAERKIDYPVTNISYVNSNIVENAINHRFYVRIADIAEPDNTEMEDNIISDALQVCEDFFTYLQNYEVGISLIKSTSIDKVIDDTGDRTCGIEFTITLQILRPQNRCNTPTKS